MRGEGWERGAEGPGAGMRVHGSLAFYKSRPRHVLAPLCLQFRGQGGLTVTPLLTPAVQMLGQPHRQPTLKPVIGPASTPACRPPLHPCPGPALPAFFRCHSSGGGVGWGCSVHTGWGFLLASCRARSTRQGKPHLGPPPTLSMSGTQGCLPNPVFPKLWGEGAGRAAGVSPRLSLCTQAGQGPPAPPAAVKVRKETQSSTLTALDPPGRSVCWEP